MSNVFVSYNNIISTLGITSEENVSNISRNISGVKKVDDKCILPNSFYSAIIDETIINTLVKEKKEEFKYTKLEKMMIASVKDVLESSKVPVNERLGVIISTTKGNVDVLNPNSDFNSGRAYLGELGEQIKDYFGFFHAPLVLSNACVSGVLAVAIAKRYIQSGGYDNIIVVGGDLVSEFILTGFNSFQALSSSRCKPYDKNRDGINIGEVAASVLVTKDVKYLNEDTVEIIGEASCNDANHISGPSRTGEGLYRSVKSALKQANISNKDIDYISAHGTATLFNDEMEAIAFNRLGLQNTPLNSLKGYYGHTLGASGLLEVIVGMHSLKNNMLYASFGFNELGVSQPINVIKENKKENLSVFLKTASGFGGCNTAVLLKKIK